MYCNDDRRLPAQNMEELILNKMDDRTKDSLNKVLSKLESKTFPEGQASLDKIQKRVAAWQTDGGNDFTPMDGVSFFAETRKALSNIPIGRSVSQRNQWYLEHYSGSLEEHVLRIDHAIKLTMDAPQLLNSIRFLNGDTLLHHLLRFSTYLRQCNNPRPTTKLRVQAIHYALQRLLHAGCLAETVNFDNETPLQCFMLTLQTLNAINRIDLSDGSFRPGDCDGVTVIIIRTLLKHSLDPEAQMVCGSHSLLSLLLDNSRYYLSQTSLRGEMMEVVDLLCDYGADVNDLTPASSVTGRQGQRVTAFTYWLEKCLQDVSRVKVTPEFFLAILDRLHPADEFLHLASHQCVHLLIEVALALDDSTLLTQYFTRGIVPDCGYQKCSKTNCTLQNNLNELKLGRRCLSYMYHIKNEEEHRKILLLLYNSLEQQNLNLICQLIEGYLAILDKHHPLVSWKEVILTSPRQLKILCRRCIYNAIGWRMLGNESRLPLPKCTIQYLLAITG